MAVRHHALSSVRQSLMDEISNGSNALDLARTLAAFRELLDGGFAGASPMDARTGRTLRTIALPQRFGTPDSFSAAGVAQWVPAAWFAAGSMDRDRLRAPARRRRQHAAPMKYPARNGALCRHARGGSQEWTRAVGPARQRANNLKAAARSANGRFLAMGTTYTTGGWKHRVTLWDVAQGRTPAQLDTSSIPRDSEIQRWPFVERFGVVGTRHARTDVVAIVPAALRDHATRGAARINPATEAMASTGRRLHDR